MPCQALSLPEAGQNHQEARGNLSMKALLRPGEGPSPFSIYDFEIRFLQRRLPKPY